MSAVGSGSRTGSMELGLLQLLKRETRHALVADATFDFAWRRQFK